MAERGPVRHARKTDLNGVQPSDPPWARLLFLVVQGRDGQWWRAILLVVLLLLLVIALVVLIDMIMIGSLTSAGSLIAAGALAWYRHRRNTVNRAVTGRR